MEARNHRRPVGFRRNSGMNSPMRVEQNMSQMYVINHKQIRTSRADKKLTRHRWRDRLGIEREKDVMDRVWNLEIGRAHV